MFNEDSQTNSNLSSPVSAAPLAASNKMCESDIIELTSKWNLMVAYTLLDLEGFVFNADNLRKKMNISLDEASVVIESLKDMNLLESDLDGKVRGKPLFFDENDISVSDSLNNNLKIKRQAIERLTSKDVMGFQIDVMSKQVVSKYFAELYALLQRIAEESKGKDDCEVYSFDFAFTPATGTRKAK